LDNVHKRLYRTGDLVKVLPDGVNVMYTTRNDFQVKIRGIRVELGEIERVLCQHADVKDAIAIVEQGQPYAFVLRSEKANSIDQTTLRKHCATTLPVYMVPSTFVEVDQWPMTPSGKVDRKKLQVPTAASILNEVEYVAPSNAIENALCKLLTEILKLERLSVAQGLESVGMNSLQLVRFVYGCRQLGFKLPSGGDFRMYTVQQLASMIQSLSPLAAVQQQQQSISTTAQPTSSVTFTKVPNSLKAMLPIAPLQESLWIEHELMTETELDSYIISYVYVVDGRLDLKLLQNALDAVVNRHDSLRSTFHKADGGDPYLSVAPARADFVKIHFRDLLHDEASKKERNIESSTALNYIMEQFKVHFDLTKAPLMRAIVVRRAKGKYLVAFQFHHIVFDARSRELFFNELSEAYRCLKLSKPLTLKPTVVPQYIDFIVQQREQHQDQQANIDYWKRHLAQLTTLNLPLDYARLAQRSFVGDAVVVNFPLELLQSFRALCKREQLNMSSALMTSVMIVLSRFSGGQTDICIGSTVSGRTSDVWNDCIGFFVHSMPVRCELEPVTFSTMAKSVSNTFF
jgi:hypothetical protein